MGKQNLQARVTSYGIYSAWKGDGHIPQILSFTDVVPAEVGVEFGYVLHVTGGRGEQIDFRIDHPPFTDKRGKRSSAFTGTIHVKTRALDVFLGDSVWEPWEDKCGIWTLTTWHNGNELARQSFTIVPPQHEEEA